MAMDFFGTRWSLAAGSAPTCEWAAATTAGQAICSIPVHPMFFDTGSDGSAPAVCPASGVPCAPFSLVRFRRAVFKVVAFASKMHGGRFLIQFYRSSAAATAVMPPMMRYSKLVDLNGTTETEFAVDYHAICPWLGMPVQFSTVASTSYSTTAALFSNTAGTLVIRCDMPLSGPQVQAVGLKVFVRYEGLMTAMPTTQLLHTVQATATDADVPMLGTAGDAALGASTAHVHIRPLLHVAQPWLLATPTKNAAADVNTEHRIGVPTYMFATPFAGAGATPYALFQTNATQCRPTNYEWFSLCYQVFRGSMVHRLLISGSGAATVTNAYGVPTNAGLAGTQGASYTRANGNNAANWYTGWISSGYQTNHVSMVQTRAGFGELVGVTVPWCTGHPWLPTATSSCGWANNGVGPTPLTRGLSAPGVEFYVSTHDTQTSSVNLDLQFFLTVAAGDDAVFHGFSGGPVMTAKSWPVSW